MGLVKFTMPEPLHKRVKTCAAYHDKTIRDYIIDVLEDSVPREIKFDDDPMMRKKPKSSGLELKR